MWSSLDCELKYKSVLFWDTKKQWCQYLSLVKNEMFIEIK